MTAYLETIWQWIRAPRRQIYFEYPIISLAVLLPMLGSGYILTTDMAFTPQLPAPSELTNIYLFDWLLHVLSQVVPGDVLQKIILLAVLALSGISMHRLVQTTPVRNVTLESFWRWGTYFAGIFYMINPFVYSRFMAGQYLVLIGYALLPFFVRALLKLIADPGAKTAVVLAGWATLISIVSLHHAGIMALIGVVGLTLALWRYRSKTGKIVRTLKWSALGLGVTVVASSYWLVPAALGNTSIGQAVSSFGQNSADAFATGQSGALGSIGNVVRLQGFWLEERNLFILPQEQVLGWGVIVLALWVLVGMGVAFGLKNKRFATVLFGVLAAAGIVLATTPLVQWLSGFVPFLSGYREPHKFVNLVVLGYAYLGAMGVVSLMQRLGTRTPAATQSLAMTLVLVLPLAITPTMLWGFSGQLTPRHYPAEWYAMNDRLNGGTSEFKVLFLPWHQYMEFGFSGRIIANPADKFFDKHIIVSDDPEFKNAGPTVPNPGNRQIEQQVLSEQARVSGQLAHQLASFGVKYVLLAKEHDFAGYSWLDTQGGLVLEHEDAQFRLYKNTVFTGGGA